MQDLSRAIAAIREQARPLVGSRDDCDPLVQAAAGARLVLLGEASHGTPRVLPAARARSPGG